MDDAHADYAVLFDVLVREKIFENYCLAEAAPSLCLGMGQIAVYCDYKIAPLYSTSQQCYWSEEEEVVVDRRYSSCHVVMFGTFNFTTLLLLLLLLHVYIIFRDVVKFLDNVIVDFVADIAL